MRWLCLLLLGCGPAYSEAPPAMPDNAAEAPPPQAPLQEEPEPAPALAAPDIRLSVGEQPLAADLEALPGWAVRNAGRLPGHRPSVYAIRDADEAYDSLEASPGAFHGVLVCRLEVLGDRRWDDGRNTHPDVTLRLRFGDAEVNIRGPEDRKLFVSSVPNVRLASGDEVGVIAIDRDVMMDDSIARLTVRYDGLPLVAADEKVRVECRGIPQATARERAARRLQEFLAGFEVLAPAPDDMPSAERQAREARRPILRLAAWLGWAHPTVRACDEAVDQQMASWAHQPREHGDGRGPTQPAL